MTAKLFGRIWEPAVLLGFAICVFGLPWPNTPQGLRDLEVGVAVLFSFLGLMAWWVGAFSRPSGEASRIGRGIFLVLTAGVLASAVMKLGMLQFGGFDHSALIDMGWRLFRGQQPFRDFPCTTPPIFYLGSWGAFELFGPSWRSLVLATAIFAILSFLWSYALLVLVFRETRISWLLAFFLQTCTSVLVAYWWYNPLTTLAACLFFLSCAAWFSEPERAWVKASFLFSLILLGLGKPNVAGLLIVGVMAIAAWTPHRGSIGVLALTAGGVSWVGLAALGISPPDMIGGYLGISGRGFSLDQLFQDLPKNERKVFSLLLVAVLVPWVCIFRHGDRLRKDPLAWLALLGFGAGLWGFLTNGEAKPVDIPLISISSFLGLFLLNRVKSDSKRKCHLNRNWLNFCLWIVFVSTGIAAAQGITRHRVELIGPGAFFEPQLSNKQDLPIFFQGLKAGDRFHGVCSEISAVLQKEGSQSVYFGPRMQWAYAAFGLDSPQGLPPWWHPGVSFAIKEEKEYLTAWMNHRFGALVFLKNDFTYMTQEFLSMIGSRYEIDQSFPNLTILKARGI